MALIRIARSPMAQDVAVVVVVAILLVGGAAVVAGDPGEPALTVGGALLLAASAIPLGWRRTWPIAAALGSGALTVIYGVSELPDPPFPVAGIVALYSVARWCSRPVVLFTAAAVPVGMLIGIAWAGDSGADDYYRNLIPAAAALIVGDQVRERVRAVQGRRSAELDDAVRAERGRIARELHDVVAHHVAMVVVQAEAGAADSEAGGAEAPVTERFDEISASARGALGELRLLLDVLRDGEDGADAAPQPGLADLPALVDRVRTAGVPVQLEERGVPRTLSVGTDLSAYRIVQEALTNVVRHAGTVPTTVRVEWDDANLVVAVIDEGPASDAPDGRGRGLVGIRERVSLLGGEVTIGPRPTGGFEVAATIPALPVGP